MSRHKAKKHREEQEQEAIMFGKMCGCGKCRFCMVYEQERVWEYMSDLVKAQTADKAEAIRQEILKELTNE